MLNKKCERILDEVSYRKTSNLVNLGADEMWVLQWLRCCAIFWSVCELAGFLSLVRDVWCKNFVIRLVVDWILLTKRLLLRTKLRSRLPDRTAVVLCPAITVCRCTIIVGVTGFSIYAV